MCQEGVQGDPTQIGTLDPRNLLLRQPHLELDGRELHRRLADALQERQPARVVMDVREQVLHRERTGPVETNTAYLCDLLIDLLLLC